MQLAQRAFFARERSAPVAHPETLLGALHLLLGRDQSLADLHERRVLLRDPTLEQALGERRHFFAQAALCDRERRGILVALALRTLGAVAHPVVGAGDDVALALDEITGVLAATPTSSAAPGLRLAVVA